MNNKEMSKNEMSKNELLRQIMAYDFSLIDLHLYLNTHPTDQRAIALYNQYVQTVLMLRNQYQMIYGPLLWNHFTSTCPWQWIEGPYPWEKGG